MSPIDCSSIGFIERQLRPMISKNHIQNNFSKALKRARIAQGLSQESFGLVSSRTYVSSLERGLKVPTLNKVDELAQVICIHPLTLLALAYTVDCPRAELGLLMQKVTDELYKVLD
jgi:transcriptional regulator with XRE-family HTH domain